MPGQGCICRRIQIQCLSEQNNMQLIIFQRYQMENNNFNELIDLIRYNTQFSSILKQREEEFLIKLYKISELNQDNIVELYSTMKKKFYYKRKISNEEYWYENQLRIFIYLLFAYLEIFTKRLNQLRQEDQNYFSLIFNYKKPIFFQFQAMSIIKIASKTVGWGLEQTQLLKQIIEQKKMKNRWNSIARELFIRSNKNYFRNPKQCRERWMNHLDPSKIRTQWSSEQDLLLLNCIKKKGKKWSTAVKELNNTRTQHMVKNRYKSLIYNESKKQPAGKRQSELQTIIIKRLSKTFIKCKKPEQNKADDINQIKIQQGFHEMKRQNGYPFDKDIKMQEKEYKVNRQDLSRNLQMQMQHKQSDNMDPFSGQFCESSPIFIPWRVDMHIDYNQQIYLDSEDKIIIENNICQSNEQEHQHFFRS